MGSTMNGTTCNTVVSVFFCLCLIAAGMRFYTRLYLLRKFSADDYVLLVGLFFMIPYTAVYYKLIYHLFYLPFDEYTLQVLSNFFKWQFIMMPFYYMASLFVKLSIALRVLKFTGEAPVLRWIVITVITLYIADVIVMIAINFTTCLLHIFKWGRPISVAWGPHCVRPAGFRAANWVFSSMTCFVDFTLAIVPWFVVRKLWTANRRTRTILATLLGLGSIASLATIARMFYNQRFASYPDPTTAGNFFIWLYLELALATLACCLATLKPLIYKVMGDRLTRASINPRSTDALKTDRTTSSTWSSYVRQYFVRDMGPRRQRDEETAVDTVATAESKWVDMGERESPNERGRKAAPRHALPRFLSTAANSQPQWPPDLRSAITPRVLRRPTSVDSNDVASTSQRFSGSRGQPISQNTTRFTATTLSTYSRDDWDDASISDRPLSDVYNSLEAQISYALDDVQQEHTDDVISLSRSST